MDKDLRSRNYLVDKLMKESDRRDQQVKDNQQKIKDLENKSVDNENRLFALNTDIESFKMNYQIFQRGVDGLKDKISEYDGFNDRITQNEKDIGELKREIEKAQRPVFTGGEGGLDSDAMDNMLDNFRKEMHTLFAAREEMENLKDRVQGLEDREKETVEKLDQTSDLANKNKEEIEKLKNLGDKVDSDLFDQEIANLKEAIKNAGGDVTKVATNTGGNFSTKEMSKIKDMLGKFDDIEKAIEMMKKLGNLDQLLKDIDGKVDRSELEKLAKDLKALKDLLDHLSRDIDFLKASSGGAGRGADGPSPDVVIQITNKIEKLEIKLGNLENELNSLSRARAQTVPMPAQPAANSGVDSAKVDMLERRLDGLEDDFKKFNNEIIKEIKNHQDQINGKTDYGQLEELKDFLLGKIDDLARSLKQFADKNDTK